MNRICQPGGHACGYTVSLCQLCGSGAPISSFMRLEKGEADQWQVVFQEHVINPKLYSWGAGNLNAMLKTVRLEPGSYKVQLLGETNSELFAQLDISFGITKAYMGK